MLECETHLEVPLIITRYAENMSRAEGRQATYREKDREPNAGLRLTKVFVPVHAASVGKVGSIASFMEGH